MIVARAARWYWQANLAAWDRLRAHTPLLLCLALVASGGLWAVGAATGRAEFSIPLTAVGGTMLLGVGLARWLR